MISPESFFPTLLIISLNLTLGVIGLYEYVYRPKIERYEDLLIRYASDELNRLRGALTLPAESQAIKDFSDKVTELNSLIKSPMAFMQWRTYLIGLWLLIVLSVLYYIFYNSSVDMQNWCILLFILSFLANGYFMRQVWKMDKKIRELTKEREKPIF